MLTTAARRATALTVLALLLSGRPAHAHFMLLYPPERGVSLESAPCGSAGSSRGAAPTMLRPGQKIIVRWEVQVEHLQPPRFRIAFDDAGQDFPTPVGAHDASTLPLFLDGVLATGGGVQTKEIALPNVECDNCTLQMLQYLSPGPPYPADSFYYHCADITLSAGAPAPVDAASERADAGVEATAERPSIAPDATPANDATTATDASAAERPDPGAAPTVTGASGCRQAGDGPTGLKAQVFLAALLAWAGRRSST